MKNKIAVLLGLLCLWAGTAQAQKVIRLYPGAAPGSENWTQQEREMTRPPLVTNVVQPIYVFVGELKNKPAANDAPPMFIAAATDDDLVPGSVQLYHQWLAAKKPVEIHLYAKGGHGFGVRKQNLPTDQWIDRFGDWLQMQGLLKK